MRCYRCGAQLNSTDYCPGCGIYIVHYRKITHLSNYYYNEGLRKAGIRDLSGARENLTRSLKYNKRNVPARNLLGLVYYETGHVAEALSEWIVSANIQPEQNPASEYVQRIQDDSTELQTMSEGISAYNQCVKYLKQGNRDLAILHLKKIMTDAPKLVEPYQLLALICMQAGKYENAGTYLKEAYRIDHGDVRTLEMMAELQQMAVRTDKVIDSVVQPRQVKEKKKEKHTISYTLGNETIIQPKNTGLIEKIDFRKINTIQLGTALLLAAAVVWFLIIPARIQNAYSKINDTTRSYNDEMGELQSENEDLRTQLEAAQTQIESATKQADTAKSGTDVYDTLLTLQKNYLRGEYQDVEMAQELVKIDKDKLSETAQTTYAVLYEACFDSAIDSLYSDAMSNMDWEQYQTAADLLEQVVSMQEDYYDGGALYNLGQCYEQLGNKSKAQQAYNKVIKSYPKSGYIDLVKEAKLNLNSSKKNTDDSSDDGSDDNYDDYYDDSYSDYSDDYSDDYYE